MKQMILVGILTLSIMLAAGQDTPKRCEGTTTKGAQCKNRALQGSKFCRYHDKGLQCGAKTSKGTPCKLPVKKPGEHCWRHS